MWSIQIFPFNSIFYKAASIPTISGTNNVPNLFGDVVLQYITLCSQPWQYFTESLGNVEKLITAWTIICPRRAHLFKKFKTGPLLSYWFHTPSFVVMFFIYRICSFQDKPEALYVWTPIHIRLFYMLTLLFQSTRKPLTYIVTYKFS